MDKYDLYLQNFDAEAAKNAVVEWIRNKMNAFGTDSKAVIGISGGKDSSVVAALCVEAIGKDRVYGVMIPNGMQADIKDSKQLIKYLDIHSHLINIKSICNEFARVVELTLSKPNEQAMINMPPRVRMVSLYMIAQTLGNAFVINTGNLSERFVGYFTWHGDGAGDFAPIANFTSDEVMAIGDTLNLPEYLVHKTPADGLSGKSDEDRLGFSYRTLNEYIRLGTITDEVVKNKIDKLHSQNAFKQLPLDSFCLT